MEGSVGEYGGKRMVEGNDAEKESNEVLKKMIASHPLYGLLIESHFNCLKVGLGECGELDITNDASKELANSVLKAASPPSSSELDHFMEGYCMALSSLKEAIEAPTKETKAFINAMHFELKELSKPNNPQETMKCSKNLDDDSDH